MQVPLQAKNDAKAVKTGNARTVARKRVLIDNRPEAVAQRKLAEAMNNSPRGLQQNALSDAMHNSQRMVAQRQKMNAIFGAAAEPQRVGAVPAGLSHSQREERPNNTGLPNQLKAGIESLSGLSMDHVKVHYNSDKPAQLQAHAYARGNEIHLGAGQERHLPHEAWHVVQQAQGRVRPTLQMKGGAVNDDPSLEKEADMMGKRAAQFEDGQVARSIAPKEWTANKASRAPAPTLPMLSSAATVSQRKLLLDPGTVTYSIDGKGDDYVYVGVYNGTHRYVRVADLELLKTQANNLWTKVKAKYGGSGNMKLIKAMEEKNNFDEHSDLAPGEHKYETARDDMTKLYIVGSRAPGNEFYKEFVKNNGVWKELQFYHADNEDDDKATSMTGSLASKLAENYDLFSTMLQTFMINQAEPYEKSVGGGADRTAKATGKIHIKDTDAAGFSWKGADNPYGEKLEESDVVHVPVLPGGAHPNIPLEIKGKKVVYVTTELTKKRQSANLYINDKPYTEDWIEANKTQAAITGPWAALQNKAPKTQRAETFSRKDRGKGQANAMGKWSANAAVAVSNAIKGTSYDVSRAWEWLHLRGAGLGGSTVAGNLTPGTFSANSNMIPIENKIKSLKSNPDVEKLVAEFEPQEVSGVFANKIKIDVNVTYKGFIPQNGSWTIDTRTGAVFDKMHEKHLLQDVKSKLDAPPPPPPQVQG